MLQSKVLQNGLRYQTAYCRFGSMSIAQIVTNPSMGAIYFYIYRVTSCHLPTD